MLLYCTPKEVAERQQTIGLAQALHSAWGLPMGYKEEQPGNPMQVAYDDWSVFETDARSNGVTGAYLVTMGEYKLLSAGRVRRCECEETCND